MGRGRLSNIELLPEPCAHVVDWAASELQKRQRTQTEIYSEFYSKLEAVQREYRGELELTIPSFTAFNRYSLNLDRMTRRINDTQEIAKALSAEFDPEASDNLTLIAAEAIKTLIFELLTDGGEAGIDPKGAMALANALRAAAQAQGISSGRRQKVEAELAEKAKSVVQAVVKAKGVSQEAAQEILDRFLGISK